MDHDGDHGVGGWSGPWPNSGPNTDVLDFSNVKVYLVGGAVREIVRGFPELIKDWDFAIEAESFSQMRDWINFNGFEIFVETPEYFTIRARAPKGYEFAGIDMTGKTFDFALCRSEGSYSDGRHPDEVKPGTLSEDLARRDFTMNAMAMTKDSVLIDPHNGRKSLWDATIYSVRRAEDRFNEDALRIMRAVRFAVQLDFLLSEEIASFIRTKENLDLLDQISENRIRDEVEKMFNVDTIRSMWIFEDFDRLRQKVFSGNIRLIPSLKKKPKVVSKPSA